MQQWKSLVAVSVYVLVLFTASSSHAQLDEKLNDSRARLSTGLGFASLLDEPGYSWMLALGGDVGDGYYMFRYHGFSTRFLLEDISEDVFSGIFGGEEDGFDMDATSLSVMYGREFFNSQLAISTGVGYITSEYSQSDEDIFSGASIPVEITLRLPRFLGVHADLSYIADIHQDATLEALMISGRMRF